MWLLLVRKMDEDLLPRNAALLVDDVSHHTLSNFVPHQR